MHMRAVRIPGILKRQWPNLMISRYFFYKIRDNSLRCGKGSNVSCEGKAGDCTFSLKANNTTTHKNITIKNLLS